MCTLVRCVRYGEVTLCMYVYGPINKAPCQRSSSSSWPPLLTFLTFLIFLGSSFMIIYYLLTSTSTFLSYHFYSFYISSHCCLSIHHPHLSRCKVPLYFYSLPIYRDGIYPKNTPLIPIRPSTVWILHRWGSYPQPGIGNSTLCRCQNLKSLSLKLITLIS